MWAVYEINRHTGTVIWTLGGKHSSFHMGPGTNFEWQHDAHLTRRHADPLRRRLRRLPQEERESSAKALKVNIADQDRRRSMHRYTHTSPALAGAMGSVQLLPNGNVFVGWGTATTSPSTRVAGGQVFNGTFPLGTNSYRAYRFPWAGQPTDATGLRRRTTEQRAPQRLRELERGNAGRAVARTGRLQPDICCCRWTRPQGQTSKP